MISLSSFLLSQRLFFSQMCIRDSDMTNTIYIHQPEKAVSFTRLPNFLFEAPTFSPLSNEAKALYALILRRTEVSRKNGWADEDVYKRQAFALCTCLPAIPFT